MRMGWTDNRKTTCLQSRLSPLRRDKKRRKTLEGGKTRIWTKKIKPKATFMHHTLLKTLSVEGNLWLFNYTSTFLTSRNTPPSDKSYPDIYVRAFQKLDVIYSGSASYYSNPKERWWKWSGFARPFCTGPLQSSLVKWLVKGYGLALPLGVRAE